MSRYISVSNAVSTNLSTPADPRYLIDKDKKYSKTSFSYNYGSSEQPVQDKAMFKLKIAKGRLFMWNNKLRLRLYLTDEADLAGLSQLSIGFAQCVEKNKNIFNIRCFKSTDPGGLRKAFYYPMNERTGEPIVGTDARMDIKITNQSIFQLRGPTETEKIDPITLINKEIICSVIFHVSHLTHYDYLPVPQIFVRSCIILDITDEIENYHIEDEDIKQYINNNAVKSQDTWNIFQKICADKKKQVPEVSLVPNYPYKMEQVPVVSPQNVTDCCSSSLDLTAFLGGCLTKL